MRFLLLVLVSYMCSLVYAASSVNAPHIQVSLVTEHARVSAGLHTKVGVHFVPEPGWHVYWRNPGDTGMAPRIEWSSPSEVSIGDAAWAFPQKIPVGPLVNIGFEKDLFVPFDIAIPQSVTGNQKLQATISWLVCKEECIPGSATLETDLVFMDRAIKSKTMHARLFTTWEPKMPVNTPAIGAEFKIKDNQLQLDLYAGNRVFSHAKKVNIFVEELNVISYGKPTQLSWRNNHLRWHQPLSDAYNTLPDTLHLVAVLDDTRAFRFTLNTKP